MPENLIILRPECDEPVAGARLDRLFSRAVDDLAKDGISLEAASTITTAAALKKELAGGFLQKKRVLFMAALDETGVNTEAWAMMAAIRRAPDGLEGSFGALVIDAAFSTPHFISLLIGHGFIRDDAGLPVLRTPIYVTDDDLTCLRKAMAENSPYKLPVVLVSGTAENEDPLSTAWLASRLKGAAHVLVGQNTDRCAAIRKLAGKTDTPFGRSASIILRDR